MCGKWTRCFAKPLKIWCMYVCVTYVWLSCNTVFPDLRSQRIICQVSIQVHVCGISYSFLFLYIFSIAMPWPDSMSVLLPACWQHGNFPEKVIVAASWKHKLQKLKFSWSSMRKDERTLSLFRMLCIVSALCFSFSQSGTSVFFWWCHTLWQLSAICLDCFLAWQIWCFFLPLQPPTQSLSRKSVYVCIRSVWRKEKKNLSEWFWKKVFCFFSLQKREQVCDWGE